MRTVSDYAGRCFSLRWSLMKTPPEWVNWIAQDADGAWWGFSVEPLEAHAFWYENEVGRYVSLGREAPNKDWRNTLQRVNRGTPSNGR